MGYTLVDFFSNEVNFYCVYRINFSRLPCTCIARSLFEIHGNYFIIFLARLIWIKEGFNGCRSKKAVNIYGLRI